MQAFTDRGWVLIGYLIAALLLLATAGLLFSDRTMIVLAVLGTFAITALKEFVLMKSYQVPWQNPPAVRHILLNVKIAIAGIVAFGLYRICCWFVYGGV